MSNSFFNGFVKRANEHGIHPQQAEHAFRQMIGGHMGHNFQQFMAPHPRRELSEFEQDDVSKAKGKIFPKIFKSNKDPIHADMSSPWVPGMGLGALGAGVGGLAGLAGGTLGAGGDTSGMSDELGGGLGALLGGGIAGTVGYKGREAKNNTLEDAMQRNQPGATRRDLMADPVFQKEKDRELQERLAQMQSMQPYGNPYFRQ